MLNILHPFQPHTKLPTVQPVPKRCRYTLYIDVQSVNKSLQAVTLMAFSKSVGNSPSGQSDDSWSSSSSHVNLSRRTSFSAPARLGRREPPRLNPAGHILAPGIGAHRSHDEGIANPSPPTTLIDDEDDGSTTPRVRVRFGFPSYPVPSLSARGAQVPVLNTSTYINATGQCQPQFPGHHATSFALQQQQQRLGQLVPQLVDANNRGQGQFPSSVNDFNGGNTTAFALRVLRQQVRLGPQSVNTTNGRNTTFTMSHQDQSGGAQPMPSGMANVQARGIAAANNTNANEAALLRALEAQLPADQAPNSAQSNGFQPNPRANTFQPNPLANAFQPGAREFNGDGNGYVGAPPHDVQRMQTPVPLQEGPFTPDGFTPTTYRHTPYGSDHHSATESPSGPFGDAFAEDSRVAFNNQLSIQLSNQLNDHLSNQLRSDQFTSGLIQHGAVQGSLSHVIEPIESDVVAMRSVVPEHIRRTRSRQLNELTLGPNMRPPAHIALHRDNFPFVDGPSQAKPTHQRGVVKFKNVSHAALPRYLPPPSSDQPSSQIPYGTKRNEIVALIGRNSHMLNDRDEPVHIIMERTTNRTNDAYVEFMTYRAAVDCVAKIEGQKNSEGRPPRLGDRPVELQLSSQAALMGDLFTQAKGVSWVSIEPTIYQNDNEPYPWKCFKGFITAEEMIMIIKHVEVPQRVSPPRPVIPPAPLLIQSPPVAVLQGLPRAPLRLLDQHPQEVPLVHDPVHHHSSA